MGRFFGVLELVSFKIFLPLKPNRDTKLSLNPQHGPFNVKILPPPLKPSHRTDSYGKSSITLGASNSWNKTQHQFSDLSFKTFSPIKVKSLLFKKCFGNH